MKEILIDLALFAAWFAVAFGIVWIGSAREIRRGKK
jgi:hypothetical protein